MTHKYNDFPTFHKDMSCLLLTSHGSVIIESRVRARYNWYGQTAIRVIHVTLSFGAFKYLMFNSGEDSSSVVAFDGLMYLNLSVNSHMHNFTGWSTCHNDAFRWWGWHHLLTNEHSPVWLRIICGPENRRCVHIVTDISAPESGPRLSLVCHSWPALPEPEAGVASDNRYPQTTAPPSAVQAQSAAYTIPITYSIHGHQYGNSWWGLSKWFLNLLWEQSDTSWHNRSWVPQQRFWGWLLRLSCSLFLVKSKDQKLLDNHIFWW